MLERKLKHLNWLLWACRGVVVFGFTISAAGNVLHAQKNPISIGIALTAPVICLMAIELGSRIPLPGMTAGWLRIIGTGLRIAATGTIAIFMAIISYTHQRAAVLRYSDDQRQATLLPGAVDAFMVIGSVCVMEIQAQLRELEAKIAGIDLAKAKAQEPGKPREKAPSQRERIATAMTEMPWATAKEIAAKLQIKEAYASNVMSELRKAQRTNGKAVSVHN